MPGVLASRMIGDLVLGEIETALRANSVLCLPMGSMEQHGPHLPLNTDCVIAEALTRRIVARFGQEHDLWQLPVVPIGLSREHDWAPGTFSFSVSRMAEYLRELGGAIIRALPARNLLIVNGHGGNRGVLEAVTRELSGDFGLNIATMHLGAAMSPDITADIPEIHAGKDETSVMLALAPELVRRKVLAKLKPAPARGATRVLVLDPVASYPWNSDDPRLSASGIMGDARGSSAAHGKLIIARVVEAAGPIIRQLKSNAAVKTPARRAKRRS